MLYWPYDRFFCRAGADDDTDWLADADGCGKTGCGRSNWLSEGTRSLLGEVVLLLLLLLSGGGGGCLFSSWKEIISLRDGRVRVFGSAGEIIRELSKRRSLAGSIDRGAGV